MINRTHIGKTKGTEASSIQGPPCLQRKCACGGPQGSCRCGTGSGKTSTHAQLPVRMALQTSGQILDPNTRLYMESRFGHDFSQVRVHTDQNATNSVRALAFTSGNQIVFGERKYAPETVEGKRLLAHELAHVVQQRKTSEVIAPASVIGASQDAAEQEADYAAASVLAHSPVQILHHATGVQRYSHSDCLEDDLRSHVWPADGKAKQMVAKAIRVLNASSTDPAVQKLLTKHFRSATPNLTTIRNTYEKISADFAKDSYTYECESECSETESAYVRHRLRYIGISPNIHLCMPVLRGYSNDCVASIVVHEFSHYSAHTDDKSPCYSSCDTGGCPASFPEADALDNASSYANFAFELFSLGI